MLIGVYSLAVVSSGGRFEYRISFIDIHTKGCVFLYSYIFLPWYPSLFQYQLAQSPNQKHHSYALHPTSVDCELHVGHIPLYNHRLFVRLLCGRTMVLEIYRVHMFANVSEYLYDRDRDIKLTSRVILYFSARFSAVMPMGVPTYESVRL